MFDNEGTSKSSIRNNSNNNNLLLISLQSIKFLLKRVNKEKIKIQKITILGVKKNFVSFNKTTA